MYHALEGLKDVLDGDLDTAEGAQIKAKLAIAKQSDREEIASLAMAVGNYLDKERQHLSAAKPGFWKRTGRRMDAYGERLGRRRHRTIITLILITWLIISAVWYADPTKKLSWRLSWRSDQMA